jgi:hypothetical protein
MPQLVPNELALCSLCWQPLDRADWVTDVWHPASA